MAGEVPPTSQILSSCIWEKRILQYSCHLKTVLPNIEYRTLYCLPRKKYLCHCIATAFYIYFGVNTYLTDDSHSCGHDYDYRLHTESITTTTGSFQSANVSSRVTPHTSVVLELYMPLLHYNVSWYSASKFNDELEHKPDSQSHTRSTRIPHPDWASSGTK